MSTAPAPTYTAATRRMPDGLRGSLRAAILAAASLAGISCGDESLAPQYGGGDFVLVLESGGLEREYIVHVPGSVVPDQAAPILFAFHGLGQTASELRNFTELNTYADAKGMIAVYPQAHERLGFSWAVTETLTRLDGVDDIRFTVDLIERTASQLNIDRQRVYATGLSNGALFAHRVGCELADRVRGIASVAATMIGEVASSCRPSRGISALFIQGTDDTFFPWAGDFNQDLLSAEDTVDRWLFANACPGDMTVEALPDTSADNTTVELRRFAGCRDGSEVLFYVVTGGGHTWPGSRQQFSESIVGRTSRDMVASELIVDFFATH